MVVDQRPVCMVPEGRSRIVRLSNSRHRYDPMSMRISELSRTTGVPVPTIKFYLREQLLAPGRATAKTQAEYDSTHVERLRLIRALTDVGRMSLATARTVLAAVDAGAAATPQAVGQAARGLPPVTPRPHEQPTPPPDGVEQLGR